MISADIHASFARQTMMATLGATLTDLGQGSAEITAPILPTSQQQHGFGHAALTFAIGDSAAGYGALTMMEDGAEVLTAEMKINLLRPAQGDLLIAREKVVKPGCRLTIVTAMVTARVDGAEVEIALLQGTMMPV